MTAGLDGGQSRRPRRSPSPPRRRRSSLLPRHTSRRLAKLTRPLPREPPPPERIVFEQAQAFQHAQEQRRIFFAEHVHHQARAEARAGGNALQGARVGLRGDAVDGVLALHFGQLVVQVLAHLRGDAFGIERRVEHRQPRRRGLRWFRAFRPARAPCGPGCGRTAGRFRRRDGRSGGCALPAPCGAKGTPARRARPGRKTAPAASGSCRAASCPARRAGRRRP